MQRLFHTTKKIQTNFNYVNKVFLCGHIGQTPQLIHLPSTSTPTSTTNEKEKSLLTFSLATHSYYKPANGELQKKTEWHHIVVSNQNLIEFGNKFLEKGKKVWVEGQLVYKEYEKDGVKKVKSEILVGRKGDLVLMDSGKDKADHEQGPHN